MTRCADCDQPITEHAQHDLFGGIHSYWLHEPDPNTGRTADRDHPARPEEAPDENRPVEPRRIRATARLRPTRVGDDRLRGTDPAHVDLPVRPYTQEGRESAGWSGTDTSRDAEPIRAASQRAIYAFVAGQGAAGATVAEVRATTGYHHGIASGALSVLAKQGHLTMTDRKRGRCRVYVAGPA